MVREYTSKLLDLIDEGMITPEAAVHMCLSYMSEDEVKDMYYMNFLNEDEAA